MINLESFDKYAFNSKGQTKIKSSGVSKFQNVKSKKSNGRIQKETQLESNKYIQKEKPWKVREVKEKPNIVEVIPPKLKKRELKEKYKYNTFGKSKKDRDFHVKETEKLDEVEIEEGLPYFIQKEWIKDKNMKRPDDEEYDWTTLHVPPEYLASLTPAMKQYWTLKADNYDKLLLFKLGKFYELFYEDAIIGNRHLDLNWMGSIKKFHVGFPERALNKYLTVLIKIY